MQEGIEYCVYGRGVDGDSVQCTSCQKWMHKCSGTKNSRIIVSKSFVCRGCTDQPASMDRTSMGIGDGDGLELVDKFC